MAAEQPKKNANWSTERVENVLKEYERTGVLPSPSPFYMGDVRLRKPRINFTYTKEELLELSKIQNDVIYFGEKYAKVTTDEGIRTVKLRKYQIRVLKQFMFYRHNVWLASRQIGKSISPINELKVNGNSLTIGELYYHTQKSTILSKFKILLYKILAWSES